jgi:hypothetical protein
MSSQLCRTWMAIMALSALAPRIAAAKDSSSTPLTSGWQRIELPFEADGRLTAAVFRDTLFVGSTSGSGRQVLGAIPLDRVGAGSRAAACPLPAEFRIARVGSLVSMGDSLVVSCSVESDDRRHEDGLFVYDGRWRRFPTPPDWLSQSIGGLQYLDGVLYAHGRFRPSPEAPCDNVVIWDGRAWQALGLQLGWHYVGSLVVLDGALTGVFSMVDSELDENWLRRSFSRQHIASWDGTGWRALCEDRGGFLASPVVHHGELSLAHTDRRGSCGGTVDVVRLTDGELRRLGEEFGLSTGRGASVDRLVEYRGRLVAAGSFDHVGAAAADNIAFWDGTRWRGIGSLPPGTGSNFLDADQRGIWVGGGTPTTTRSGPALVFLWDAALPEQGPPAPFFPPPAGMPSVAARSDTIPPFRNGTFAEWADGAPVGWKLDASTLLRDAALLSSPASRDSLSVLPDGGVSLWPDPASRYPLTFGQSFSIEPGRCYRLRVTTRQSPRAIDGEAEMETASRLQFGLGDAWDALDLLSTGFADEELTLLAPDGASQGSVMFTCGRATERLEIQEVDIAESPLDFGACFVKREDWHDDLAVLRSAAARAVNSEVFQNILHEALRSLRDPEIRTVANKSDMTAIGMVYSDEGRPASPRGWSQPGPNERLLRLPCGVNVIYSWR